MTDQGDDAGESRAEGGKTGRDAGTELGDVVTRAARVAASALDRAGEVVGEVLGGLFEGGGGGGARGTLVSTVVPELPPLHPVHAGDEVTTRLRLVNRDDNASEPFGLAATDLVSDAGDRVPADAVSLPPEQRIVAARQSDTVSLTVNVPGDAKPGVYRGELRATDDSVEPAALVLDVR